MLLMVAVECCWKQACQQLLSCSRQTWCSPTQVTGVKPAHLWKGFLGALGVIVVPFHDPWALGKDDSLLPVWDIPVGVGIHNAKLCPWDWSACMCHEAIFEASVCHKATWETNNVCRCICCLVRQSDRWWHCSTCHDGDILGLQCKTAFVMLMCRAMPTVTGLRLTIQHIIAFPGWCSQFGAE